MEEKINRIWVPSTTEIFTEDGWLPIQFAYNTAPRVFTADLGKRKIGLQKSTAWAKKEFKGEISRRSEGLLRMEFKSASPLGKSEILDLPDEEVPSVLKQVNYTGILYSLDVEKGIVMLRCQCKADSFASNTIEYLLEDEDIEIGDGEGPSDMAFEHTIGAACYPDWWMSRTRW